MNEIKRRTFTDRIRDAVDAFIGRKTASIQFGVDLKRCDKCKIKIDHEQTKVFYICDRKQCDDCSYPTCKHTLKIEHAKNFKSNEQLGFYNGFSDYWEEEKT